MIKSVSSAWFGCELCYITVLLTQCKECIGEWPLKVRNENPFANMNLPPLFQCNSIQSQWKLNSIITDIFCVLGINQLKQKHLFRYTWQDDVMLTFETFPVLYKLMRENNSSQCGLVVSKILSDTLVRHLSGNRGFPVVLSWCNVNTSLCRQSTQTRCNVHVLVALGNWIQLN